MWCVSLGACAWDSAPAFPPSREIACVKNNDCNGRACLLGQQLISPQTIRVYRFVGFCSNISSRQVTHNAVDGALKSKNYPTGYWMMGEIAQLVECRTQKTGAVLTQVWFPDAESFFSLQESIFSVDSLTVFAHCPCSVAGRHAIVWIHGILHTLVRVGSTALTVAAVDLPRQGDRVPRKELILKYWKTEPTSTSTAASHAIAY